MHISIVLDDNEPTCCFYYFLEVPQHGYFLQLL